MFTTTSAMALFSTLSSLAASAVIVGPRDSIPIPPECDVIPAWEIASFSWFNSSQNLDCVSQNNVRTLRNIPPPFHKKKKKRYKPRLTER